MTDPAPNSTAPQPSPPRGILRALLGLPAHLYHAGLGFLLGHRFLLLVTSGRRTGQERETVVEVMRWDQASHEAIVMAGWGLRTAWLLNAEAGLALEVRIGRERYVPVHRLLPTDEAVAVLADYEWANRLAGPLVRWVISRLVGWHYDGTPEARLRVVGQLPLVGFRSSSD